MPRPLWQLKKKRKKKMNRYVTIKNNVETEIVVKKSKFIANFIKVTSKEQAEEEIKKMKKKYFDARHNCVSYRVLEDEKIVERFSDDGEPSGTAGGPMLNILQKNNLINVLIVVTRYFGGILLGTGGLVRAYSDSLQKAIEESELLELVIGVECKVELEYSYFEKFKYYCKNNDIQIKDTLYTEEIVCKIEMEENKKEKLLKDYALKNINFLNFKVLSKKYIEKSIQK